MCILTEEVIFDVYSFIQGCISGTLESSMAPSLTLKMYHFTIGDSMFSINVCFMASLMSAIRGRMSHVDVNKAIHSASLIENAISVYIQVDQTIGKFAKTITYPCMRGSNVAF